MMTPCCRLDHLVTSNKYTHFTLTIMGLVAFDVGSELLLEVPYTNSANVAVLTPHPFFLIIYRMEPLFIDLDLIETLNLHFCSRLAFFRTSISWFSANKNEKKSRQSDWNIKLIDDDCIASHCIALVSTNERDIR